MTAMGTRRRCALSYHLAAALLLLLVVALHNAPPTAAQPLPWQLCGDSAGNYTEGSAYQANIRVLASGLPKNASASPALFAKGFAGTAPDAVYALALCRGDTNASSCAACVAAAFQNAQQLCAFNRLATMFDDPCILRYSDQDFLANFTDNRGMLLLLDLSTLRAATDNFSERNKLGEGGFGSVYKGVLPEGQEVAVKRLSQTSTQGIEELKTELVLVAKLQHKNLVRLVGVCLEGQEKLLVYEYMPNRSLDTVLFDSEKRRDLDWGKRVRIVNGVARGLQYLHEDSQLRIVHRDLKASNVLLDSDCSPKISDFGLAKLFGWDQSQAVTSHIAGTYGYMAPEYAMRGQYSVKSDAFSFGVLLLEIVTGRKNSSFPDSERSIDLLSLVWEHWSTGTVEELADPSLGGRTPGGQMLKLVNIGLLCVQDNPADRPAMSAVNVMLSSGTVSLQAPSRPTFCVDDMEGFSDMYSGAYPRGSQSQSQPKAMSPNELTLTEIEPR